MNQEMIDILKNINRNFLLTEGGKDLLKISVSLKKEWDNTKKNITVSTEGVNLELFNEFIQQRTTKIKIIPIGINNMCHINSIIFCKTLSSTPIIGYNLTACPCGKKVCFELHSVNEYEGKLYDLTRDFNNEQEKYFMRLNINIEIQEYINIFGNRYKQINYGCNCNITWNKNSDTDLMKEEKLIKFFKSIEKY